MSGTATGAKQATQTNLQRHGADFYKRIGAKGGAASSTGGFACNLVGKDGLTGKERARVAGKAGGTISRKTKKGAIK